MRGEYVNTVDEKGRLVIPPKFRTELGEGTLVLTRGLSNALYLYTEEEYEKIANDIETKSNMFDKSNHHLYLRIVASCQDVNFDKAGRITIGQSFRDFASLNAKSNCTIIGLKSHVEIWNTENYEKTMNEVDIDQSAKRLGEDMRGIN